MAYKASLNLQLGFWCHLWMLFKKTLNKKIKTIDDRTLIYNAVYNTTSSFT